MARGNIPSGAVRCVLEFDPSGCQGVPDHVGCRATAAHLVSELNSYALRRASQGIQAAAT
jgi:hypothetical protein